MLDKDYKLYNSKVNNIGNLNSREPILENAASHLSTQPSKNSLPLFINIWESELLYMAGLAAHWGQIETGGWLYALLTCAGRIVIMLATPPGPKAIHKVASFQADIDLFGKLDMYLREKFGLNLTGTFHSHHSLSNKTLSGGDVQSTHSIAMKNGYRTMCQLLLTFEEDPHASYRYYDDKKLDKLSSIKTTESKTAARSYENMGFMHRDPFTSPYQVDSIRIQSFFFEDARYSEPIRCPIKIIPGVSPFRKALLSDGPQDLSKTYSFPLSQIIYDSIESQAELENYAQEIPQKISKQFKKLPQDVREGSRVVFRNGLVVLSLPAQDVKGKVLVAFSDEMPHKIEAVYFAPNKGTRKPKDLTAEALCFGPFTGLSLVYKNVIRLSHEEKSSKHPAYSHKTEKRINPLKKRWEWERKALIREDIGLGKHFSKEV